VESPAAPKRRLGHRVAGLHNARKFGIVLLLVFASFLFAASAPDAAWSASVLLVLEAATLVTALWTSGAAGAGSAISVGLTVLSLAIASANLVDSGKTLAATSGLLAAVLVVATALVIAIGVAHQPEVDARSVLGAISIYLLLGMLFMFVYGAVATLGSGSFFAQGTNGTRALRLYFSYVTLATLGYGDYTPSGTFGHTLAVVEALLGQVYLVTVVAVLVSRLGRGRV
jgi:hypothetical protein